MNGIYHGHKIDHISYSIGMINCFTEMVACGVKTLALSPPVNPSDYDIIGKASDDLCKGFGIKTYLDQELIKTDLQSEEFTKGMWSILYYGQDLTLNKYLELKKRREELISKGMYEGHARKKIAVEFGILLSYPEEKIEAILGENNPHTPFSLFNIIG